jgi:hypothetical protein
MKQSMGVFLLAALILGVCGVTNAQTEITTGTIQGAVTDEKGASVGSANVEVKNLDTNFSKTQTADADGRFTFLLLPPGRYTVTFKKDGFSTVVQEGINLTVGQALTLPVSMKVGAVTTTVTVTATPTIEVTKTESSTTLNSLTVTNTPILGRKFEDLLTLTPGVSIVQGPDGDEINFNGQRGIFNNVSMDGGDYNNGFFGEQYGGQRAAIDITLEAVKEFQVVASGAGAEFGRTAGGVVNVITKSGTNEVHGDLFEYQRLRALSANTSDGKPLVGFHREQGGGTIGGPLVKDRMFFFAALEVLNGNLQRPNLSAPLGSPCSVTAPVVGVNDAVINASGECQRVALLNFFQNKFSQTEGNPVAHPERNFALLGRYDWNINTANQFSLSYNFDYSKNINQTFDVPTYGDSANGTEGPSHIQTYNANWNRTISPTKLNEFHFSYGRESRPRLAATSMVPDTALGFATSFRFGQPFFLEPNVNELFWRTDLRDNFSIVHGKHDIKLGGGWLHSINSQVFRGFFTGRYIFDSAVGFMRYASPASMGVGFGPTAAECADGTYSDLSLLVRPNSTTTNCPNGSKFTGGPLLLYLQHAATSGPTTDATGASSIGNNHYSLFIQDKWQVLPRLTLNYGLRWESQTFPNPTLDPSKTAYGSNLSNPKFPSNGRLPNQWKEFQPRIGLAWDIRGNQKSVFRASYGIYNATQNMLTQVGAITTNGVQQQTIAAGSCLNPPACNFFNSGTAGAPPTYPGVVVPPVLPAGTFPFQAGVTVFSKDYANPRIYTTNASYEQQLYPSWTAYVDFTYSKGVHLTRFIDPNSALSGFTLPTVGSDTVTYTGAMPFPNLGSVTDTVSNARSLYKGVTFGMRKRFSSRFQMEANYTYSQDFDDDSNERDPFTFRYANFYNLAAEYAPSDRDERHKFNFYTYADLPKGFQANVRMQAHSAQPITDNVLGTGTGAPCSANNSRTRFVISSGTAIDCGRNHLRKDNAYFTFDWRLERPFHIGERFKIDPLVEMFNSFNNKNNLNPLVSPILFNFDGFLRQGVGDPLQVQLAVKLLW